MSTVVRTAHFSRSNRLLRSSDFKRLSREGKRAAGRYFVLLSIARPLPDDVESSRIGITVSRKVGNAVVRNRVKRRVREWFRHDREDLGKEMDIIVIARPAAAKLGTRETKDVLREMTWRNALVTATDRARD